MRRVSLDFTLDSYLKVLGAEDLIGDLLPICLLPKGLFHELDVIRGADAVAVASRDIDSALGQALLALIGARESGQGPPGKPVWDLLWLHCYRFPPDDDRFILEPSDQQQWVKGIARSERFALTGTDLEWWDKASESDAWVTWLVRLHRDFLFTVRLDAQPVQQHESFKVRWVDARPDAFLGATTNYSTGKNRGSFAYRIPIFDFGRARSEHVHIHAPHETFLTAPTLVRHLQKRVLAPRIRASRRRVSIYQSPQDASAGEELAIGTCDAEIQVWPSPRGFFSPMKSVCSYLLVMLGSLFAVQLFRLVSDESGRDALADNLDSITTLALFLPSLVLPLLFARDEQGMRWRLLEGWRSLIRWSFAPVTLAYATFMITPTDKYATVPWLSVFALLQGLYVVWMLIIRLRIWVDSSEIDEAEALALEAERAPAKGAREKLADEAAA